jgi:hypothetical protein
MGAGVNWRGRWDHVGAGGGRMLSGPTGRRGGHGDICVCAAAETSPQISDIF